MNYDVEVDWNLNEYCNFNCSYCFDKEDKKGKFIGQSNIQMVVNGFDNADLTWLIHMSGGEPLFYPKFVDLCEELTKKHFISINTNLSHNNIYSIAQRINPERVFFIHCSLHIQERERLKIVQDYIDKYNYLKEKGFYVYASYVMYPDLISRFKKDFEYFKSKDIILRPKVFRGRTEKFKNVDLKLFNRIKKLFVKDYPKNYSRRQKEIILSYLDETDFKGNDYVSRDDINVFKKIPIGVFNMDKYFIEGLPSFKGKICSAGKSFVIMNSNGDIYRCGDERKYFGNLFKENIKLHKISSSCNTNICSCPYVGYRYVVSGN